MAKQNCRSLSFLIVNHISQIVPGLHGSFELDPKVAKDPICGMTVDEKKTNLVSEHDGQIFYFCSAACKQKFDADPHRYAHH